MPRGPGSCKNWCFTLNNYTEESEQEIWSNITAAASYAVYGRERGDRDTPHLQGYFQLQRRLNLAAVRNVISGVAHFEPAIGTCAQNRRYCTKDGDFREHGVPPTREARRSRDEVARRFVELADSGRGLDGICEFADEEPGTYYFSGHNLRRNYLESKPTINREGISVEWIWGRPGVGKSRIAHERFPNAYIKEPKTKWWNGYLLEKEVIIDDYGHQCIDINHLLRWFDRYKCLVECKHGMLPLYAEKFIVTSNFHPCDIFKFGDERHPQLPALERRMSIVEMN